MSAMIGIDLGTTNSAVAVWQDGKPQIIPDADGHHLTPSVVAYDPEKDSWAVGRAALQMAKHNPRQVIKSIKRIMGRRFRDTAIQYIIGETNLTYHLTESQRGQGGVDVMLGNKHLTPQEIAARILIKLKEDAQAYLGRQIHETVITVPAYFNTEQRQATRDAGKIAGLDVKRVISEPTAAYLAFGYHRLAEPRKTVAAFDLGGGTFDISILAVGQGPFRVLATNGDTLLGGDDIDWAIVHWLIEQCDQVTSDPLAHDFAALFHLRTAAEQAKIALTTETETVVTLDSSLGLDLINDNLHLTLHRETLGTLVKPLIDRTLEKCRKALDDAALGESNAIQEVLMVGGQTRMPAIRQAVQEFFGIEPNVSVDPDEVVALGAAVQAAILADEIRGVRLADVVPLTLGVEIQGGLMDPVIERNSAIPISKKKIYSTTVDDQESVEILIDQGEHPQATSNVKLGSFLLGGIAPAPKGRPEIEVTFQVDANSILEVTGKDLYTGLENKITITDSVRLNDNEIADMIQDAEKFKMEYATIRHLIEQRQQAEHLIERLKQLVIEKREALSADIIESVVAAETIPDNSEMDMYLSHLRNLWHQVNNRD